MNSANTSPTLSGEDILSVTAFLDVSAVERDTGLSKETLRTWERRYGFPLPLRDPSGNRLYPVAQVEKLRVLRRLMDAGLRPAAIIHRSLDDLLQLGVERSSTLRVGDAYAAEISTVIEVLKARDTGLLRKQLRFYLVKLGIRPFVADLVGGLNAAVGMAWQRGELSIVDEHRYSEQIEAVLREAIEGVQLEPDGPRVLLSTLPGELHKIGLLMLEAILTSQLVQCIPLGTQTPVSAIAEHVKAGGVDIVALSFSSAFPKRVALKGLVELRAALPQRILICAGGDGVRGMRNVPEGILICRNFSALVAELRHWKQ